MDNKDKNWTREVFNRAAPHYGKMGCSFFDVYGKQLVAMANIKPGNKILDVATGKGAVLFPASEAVGQHGHATGIDLSPGMIEEARKRFPQLAHNLHVMDAEHLIFPDQSFDAILSGFAIFFFPNLTTALNEFKRVLKPHGRIAVSTWGRVAPLLKWTSTRAEELQQVKPLRAQKIDSSDLLRDTLLSAGFRNIEIQEREQTFWFDSPEEWWNSIWTHGIRARLEQLTPANLATLQKEALAQAQAASQNGRVGEPMHAIFGVAQL